MNFNKLHKDKIKKGSLIALISYRFCVASGGVKLMRESVLLVGVFV